MGLRARLFFLVLLSTVPALLLALYTNFELRRLGATRVQQSALQLVQFLSEGCPLPLNHFGRAS